MIIPYKEYKQDIDLCRNVHKKYGKSFYFGTLLFSPEERDAICVLYAFFRYPDEYVDTDFSDKKDIALEKLEKWNALWNEYYDNKTKTAIDEETQVLRVASYIFHKYSIPFEYSQSFLSAMIQDTYKDRYETYEDLEKYMYGSASVVGLMMTYIIYKNDQRFLQDEFYRKNILDKAQKLGEAFQMTNFLRDIGEDISQRGRIYLPLEDLKKFNVIENDIFEKKLTSEFIALVKYEIERTNKLYDQADEGIKLLPPKAARGIRVARMLYAEIISKIELLNYDILHTRVHVSFFGKIKIALKTLIKKY